MIFSWIYGSDCYLHFVKKGETLYGIARAYDLTVNDIFKSNPDSRSGIKPGIILKIPTGKVQTVSYEETQSPSNNNYFYHIVKKQETLYGISKKYKVSLTEIKTINPGIGENLKEGQTIQIPVTEQYSNFQPINNDEFLSKHIVDSGETLYGIAGKYGISTGELLNANPGMSSQLDIGQELNIPKQPDPNIVIAEEIIEDKIKKAVGDAETTWKAKHDTDVLNQNMPQGRTVRKVLAKDRKK